MVVCTYIHGKCNKEQSMHDWITVHTKGNKLVFRGDNTLPYSLAAIVFVLNNTKVKSA